MLNSVQTEFLTSAQRWHSPNWLQRQFERPTANVGNAQLGPDRVPDQCPTLALLNWRQRQFERPTANVGSNP